MKPFSILLAFFLLASFANAQQPTLVTTADPIDAPFESAIASLLQTKGGLALVTAYPMAAIGQNGSRVQIDGLVAVALSPAVSKVKALRFTIGSRITSLDLSEAAALSKALDRMSDLEFRWRSAPPQDQIEIVFRGNPRFTVGLNGTNAGPTAYVVVGYPGDAKAILGDGDLASLKRAIDSSLSLLSSK